MSYLLKDFTEISSQLIVQWSLPIIVRSLACWEEKEQRLEVEDFEEEEESEGLTIMLWRENTFPSAPQVFKARNI